MFYNFLYSHKLIFIISFQQCLSTFNIVPLTCKNLFSKESLASFKLNDYTSMFNIKSILVSPTRKSLSVLGYSNQDLSLSFFWNAFFFVHTHFRLFYALMTFEICHTNTISTDWFVPFQLLWVFYPTISLCTIFTFFYTNFYVSYRQIFRLSTPE